MKLRDQLLNALKDLPGTRRFHLHVLLSAPHKHASLFPYASVRPRVYAQNILILCSEERVHNDAEPSSLDVESDPPRVFVTAIEATLFHIPSTASAILYVAKVDSTGQGLRPAPTSALVRALVAFYAHPATRPAKLRGTTLWVHLFARAERQYLFPNSADHPGKKPLSDVRLCAWWKRVLGRVVQEVGEGEAKMYYVLPGMGELEASQALGETIGSTSKGTQWIYGHPYSQMDVSLPYSATSKAREEGFNLGQLIPSFDDDPKSRFMDEIACTTQVDGLRSPQRKRRRTETNAKDADEKKEKEKEKETRIQGELGKVDADEFWERMSFRQECVAGAVTGFFVLIFPSGVESSSHSTSTAKDNPSTNPLAPQPGEVSHHLVQRVLKSLMKGHEFSNTEHSLKCTSILENSIRGLCSGIHVPDLPTQKEKPQFLGGDGLEEQDKDKEGSPLPQFLALPSTPPRRTIPLGGPSEDISSNPFPEPEPSADAYASFMYGTAAISNPDAPPPNTVTVVAANGNGNGGGTAVPEVTVLTVRKKKRK